MLSAQQTTVSRKVFENSPIQPKGREGDQVAKRVTTAHTTAPMPYSPPKRSEAEQRRRTAEKVIVDTFLFTGPSWPGGDSLTTEDVLVGYRAAMANGKMPNLDALVQRHPSLADELRTLLS